jgi:hypothetical protein
VLAQQVLGFEFKPLVMSKKKGGEGTNTINETYLLRSRRILVRKEEIKRIVTLQFLIK